MKLSLFSKRAKIEALIVAIAIAVYSISSFGIIWYKHNFEPRKACFTVIEAIEEDGELCVRTNIRPYRCRNSLLYCKFDAMHTFASLQVGHTYSAEVVGIQVEGLEWYPCILSVSDLTPY